MVSVFAIITIYTVFQGSGISLNELTASLKEASWEGILLASVSMLGFIYFEGEALRVLVRHMGYPAKRSHGFVYSAADVYFSAITPSASGGQPASAYFMLKDGIAGTAVMAALLLNLIMYTLAILTIGLVDILIFPEVFLNFSIGCRVLIVAVIAMGVLAVSRSLAVTVAVVLMYGCYGGIMGSFPSLTSSIFGMKHTGENYGFVMFGIVFATFGAPAISGLVSRKGYEMNVVFGIGAVFAVIAFVCLTLLGRNLVKEHAEKSAGVKNDTAQVSKPQAE